MCYLHFDVRIFVTATLHFDVRIFCYRDGNNIPIIPFFVTPSFCSLRWNELGPEGGIAIAEALKINKTITNIK
jgi:hypothetical protein